MDYEALRRAYDFLEHPSFAARVSGVLGTPVERAVKLLPRSWYKGLQSAAEAAITKALDAAITSLGPEPPPGPAPGGNSALHSVLVMTAGAAGGFFGLPALLVELPITTTLMLRAIADIARGHGEDLGDVRARLACVEVFAVGGRSHGDDNAEIGYYEVRATLALHFSAVGRHADGLATVEALPTAMELVRAVAARFGIVISDKACAQAVPVAGAAAGALINAAFMQHFQDVAQGHFTIRRLERHYGPETVEAAYTAIAAAADGAACEPYLSTATSGTAG